VKAQRPNLTPKNGLPPARLRRVLSHIEAHLHQSMSLRDMAELVQMSPYHFGRLFKQSTGLSPHQYLLHQRVSRAKEMLLAETLSIAEISRRLGFASRAHFTTVFRNQVGITPRDYRLTSGR
jgi:AraC family transcriptional regulator